jgi:small GTP-binding protein
METELQDQEQTFRVAIVGEPAVGKTCFMLRLVDGRYEEEQAPTIGMEFHSKTYTFGVVKVKLQIWDTAGQENYRAITRSFYSKSHAVVLMFDLTRRNSFDLIQSWLDEVRMHCSPGTMLYLIGSQLDAVAEVPERREVQTSDAQDVVARYNLVAYYEVSAKTGEGVDSAMTEVAHTLYRSSRSSEVLTLKPSATKLKAVPKKKKKCC